ncbi:ABC transporter permease [Telmatocola sphagniphila]|uniref:ABC transporter permease n=1 Tax=Telmatocola sphagniphila TaxID=1123043 RepID=A0A8E6B2C3_9BACT|nr:ABC transporter permease [Telmatocola sphagniphila]QVL29972.1 ABC transporter permease [Telmatocola sphagniphila]
MLSFFELIGGLAHFAGQAFPAALGAIRHPSVVLRQLYNVLIGALPLGLVAGVTLGAVVWMHTHSILQRTGAADYLPTVLAAAVLLELAPIGAGLIVAARTGANLAAELGSMKIGEQIDALEMLGESPIRKLVGPRILACMLALPLLEILIGAVALLSGFVAENVIGNTSWLKYQSACLKELFAYDVIPACLKTIVFGFLIGVSGCYFGLKTSGGTEGVGRSATSGVVAACLFVLASDILLVGIIRILFG